MQHVEVTNVRNFAVLGHTSSGKTSLVDALLFKLGINDRLGSVAAGSSMADYNEEEKARKITIFAKSFMANYQSRTSGRDYELVVTDTPGYLDFFGQVIVGVRSADAAVICVDAVSGVQVGTRRAWKSCDAGGIHARAIVVTGLDKDNADFAGTCERLVASFGARCVPVVLPLPDRSGVIDVLAAKEIPEALAAQAEAMKGRLVELAAETNDTLIEKYLAGEALLPEEIGDGLVASVASGGLVPVFACVGHKDIGVRELLEGICRLLPAPADHPHKTLEGQEVDVRPEAPFVGLVWRISVDPFLGRLVHVRVLGGTLRHDTDLYNATRDLKERAGALLSLNGKKQEPVEEALAGDSVAISKLKTASVGDTLCALGTKVHLPPIVLPKPTTFQAVHAKTQADEDKIGLALARVCEEDPTLHVDRNAETKEVVLQGLGDVHIDVAVGLMKSRSNVEVTLTTPTVPYRETVTGLGEGHHKHKKQSGGRGQYGEVYLKVEPRQVSDPEWFVDAVVGGTIPGNFMPAVQKGLVEGMQAGALAGFPVTLVKVSVYDGSYHDVDSSEIAFKIAGSKALRDGMSKARPVLLEPIMTAHVTIPEQYMGDVNGDLNQKRGRILGINIENDMQVITAEVPQAELFRYSAELRSITAGQGTFETEFSRYEQVPANIAQKVIAEAQKHKKDED